jgi:hypothetical protein
VVQKKPNLKKTFLILLVCLSLKGTCQTQALKQLQLDIEKLAQLKMQLQNMYKGYAILANGYSNIKNQSLANYVLHKDFIDALSMISPAVRNDPAVNECLLLFTQVQDEYSTAYKKVKSYNVFNTKEIDFFCKAYAKILSESNTKLDALQMVLTPNKLQMNEAERIEILASLARDLDKQLAQLRNFTTQTNQLYLLRTKSKKDNQFLRYQYGLSH